MYKVTITRYKMTLWEIKLQLHNIKIAVIISYIFNFRLKWVSIYNFYYSQQFGNPQIFFFFFFFQFCNFHVCHYHYVKNIIKFNQVMLCNMLLCKIVYIFWILLPNVVRKREEEWWRWEGEWDERNEMTLSVTDVRVSAL